MMRSSLAKFQSASPMSHEELKEKKAEAWHSHNILVVIPEQHVLLRNKHLEAIIEIGNILYKGKR